MENKKGSHDSSSHSARGDMRVWSQILGATVVSLAAATQGTVLGFSAVAIPQLQNETNSDLRMTLDEASWIRK